MNKQEIELNIELLKDRCKDCERMKSDKGR